MNVPSTDLPEAPTSWALRFTLGDWNNHASVRTSRHDYRLPEDLQLQLQTRFWFPPAFLPYLSHPAIEAAGSKVMHRLAASHLVHFLDYTTLLEHRIVNRAVETIVHGELPAYIPPRMKPPRCSCIPTRVITRCSPINWPNRSPNCMVLPVVRRCRCASPA
jgi:hypothetical protein